MPDVRERPNDGNDWKWNPYAEEYDLVVGSTEDVEAADNAARELDAIIGGMPPWLADASGLTRAYDILSRVTVGVADD